MNSVEVVVGKIKRIVSNKGHMRLYLVICAIWIALSAPIFWRPHPIVRGPDVLGDYSYSAGDTSFEAARLADRINVSCKGVVLGQSDCVAREISHARFVETTRRGAIVFLPPFVLPLIVIFGALIFQWINDGYRTKSP